MSKNIRCKIEGCTNICVFDLCKSCKFYFCDKHKKMIDCHEIIHDFSIYNCYYCCDFCCNEHFYVKCDVCNDMVINSNVRFNMKDGTKFCRYPCYKY